ncbi:MAG: UvrD-helicase domain-containing protein [Holosporales bacterium]|jgi:ATP-dependent helicase/nuclease subunit A|nr:UvrD-helicase domain-containing protein [Holosporales bacterium]
MNLSSEFFEAIDITSSCCVFASAGTGKTKILVDRFVKLMILGNEPKDVMCVTFTNAATYEMKTRIERILENLNTSNDSYIISYLRDELNIDQVDEILINRARSLIFKWIEQIDFLNIVTIHSFCQELLKRYPIEAGVHPDFEVLEDTETEDCMSLAKRNFFKKVIENSDSSITVLSEFFSNSSFEELLEKIFESLPQFRRFITSNPDINSYFEKLKKIFNLRDTIIIPREYLERFGSVFNIEDFFLTKTGSIRKNLKPEEFEIAKIVYENKSSQNKKKVIHTTCSFLKIVCDILEEYQNIKREKSALDFTDIIQKCIFLLNDSVVSGFVLSQLNYSIKHIMIDEAQDLSVDQWKVISCLFDNLHTKSILVVGDPKQSIYSFQDARPEYFLNFCEHCRDVSQKTNRKFKNVYLKTCYRCAPEILEIVNSVFTNKIENYKNHTAFRKTTGIVEFIDLDKISIADFVQDLVKNQNINPNDIMILSRSRSDLIGEIMNGIMELGIETAEPDKLNMYDSLEILDMVALGEIALNKNNNYAIACVLKSPNVFSFPLTDEQIFELCSQENKSIFDNLQVTHLQIFEDIFSRKGVFEFFYYIATSVLKNKTYAVNAFLDIVLRFSEKQSNNLEDFIKWFKTHNIQYQNEQNRNNGVVFSTIHGSKGLESKVVILMDFQMVPQKNKIKFIWGKNIFLIKPSAKEQFDKITDTIDLCYKEEEKELLRLLYVAMTRAKDQLYIAGPLVKGGAFDMIHNVFSRELSLI